MDIDDAHIGRRVREIRTWRGISITTLAGLAGISQPYLSRIERGERPVTKRSTLEALANALKVSPAELTGKPYAPSDAASKETREAITALSDTLTGWWIGEIPDAPGRPWQEIESDLNRLNGSLSPNSDYAAQCMLLPSLISSLLAVVPDSQHRRAALVGLMDAYRAAGRLSYDLGFAGLPALAAERMRQVAEELDSPTWTAHAAYQRTAFISGTDRLRQYELAVMVAESSGSRVETRGMANLTAALAAAAQRNPELAQTHLNEAASLAELIDADASPWRGNYFGRTNVGIWRVSIGLELGTGTRVTEIASGVRPEGVPKSRQAAFWVDYGRALLTERKHHERGVAALAKAERLAPQQVRNNVFARDAVANLLRVSRRGVGGRELRGLAHRMGIAPNG